MMTKKPVIHCVAMLLCFTAWSYPGNKIIRHFSLPNANGDSFSTQKQHTAKGLIVIFTCNHCPFARLYTNRINELNSRFSALNVPLIAINSMDTLLYEDESFEMMKRKAQTDSFNFPYLHDSKQAIGRQFNAEHTPMAFVIWKVQNGWSIRYKGAIDDNGEHPELATAFVSNAVTELLNNKPVSQAETASFGCRIFYRKK
jgi:hypothetical protein